MAIHRGRKFLLTGEHGEEGLHGSVAKLFDFPIICNVSRSGLWGCSPSQSLARSKAMIAMVLEPGPCWMALGR